MTDAPKSTLIELTATIVASYVANNTIAGADLSSLIGNVYAALKGVGEPESAVVLERPEPAVPIRKSVTDDFLICLEDGLKFKSLKRHLRAKYNLSPEDYRARWGLPKDYPMVAPSYAAARSVVAKQTGLGERGRSSRAWQAKAG